MNELISTCSLFKGYRQEEGNRISVGFEVRWSINKTERYRKSVLAAGVPREVKSRVD